MISAAQAAITRSSFARKQRGRIGIVTSLTLWNYRYEKRPVRGEVFKGMRFRFKVSPSGLQGDPWFDCQPVFEYDPVKGWLLKGFEVLKPDTTETIPIPF